MLKAAASSAKPTKYAQNKCHGTYDGTPICMNFAAAKCSAPKTANGSAKHKLPNATTLSSPRASATSVLAANSAIRKSTTAAADIEPAVRENSKNMARMVECIEIQVYARVLKQRQFFRTTQSYELYDEPVSDLLARLDNALDRMGGSPPLGFCFYHGR